MSKAIGEKQVKGYPVEKRRVRSAEIVVHGTADKPYYEIKYQTTDGEWNIGYSSRKLEMVFVWLDECFEIVSYEQEIRDKAIDELKDKICSHFADWQYTENDKWIKDIIELASESVEEIAEQMKEVD